LDHDPQQGVKANQQIARSMDEDTATVFHGITVYGLKPQD